MDYDEFQKTKLKDLCLKCIVANFDRLMASRQTGNVPAKNFEFLQRAYSKDIFKELSYTHHLLKYVDFVLNPYLKEVDLGMCNLLPTQYEIVIEQLKVIGDTITNLKLCRYQCTLNMLLELTCRLPKVKFLSFDDTCVTDDVLQNIGKFCTALETFTLTNCFDVTDAGLTSLCPFEENDGSIRKNKILKHLDVRGTSVTAIGIAFVLRNFPNLLTIQHGDVLTAIYNMHAEDIKNNSLEQFQNYKLQELAIEYDGKFMDGTFFRACPLLCPNVTKLTVRRISSQAEIDAFMGFTELQEVGFLSTFPSADLSPFVEACGNSLEVLFLKEGNISMESLLKFCPKLKWLGLENTKFKPFKEFKDDNALVPKFLRLKFLSLEKMDFNYEDAEKSVNLVLASSPNLETLKLIAADSLTLEFVNSIAEHECMATLQEIDVSFSDISSSAAEKLLQVTPSLNVLTMLDCDFLYNDFVALQQLRQSVTINWRNNSEYSDFNNDYDTYDDLFDNVYDYFDYDSENEYDDEYSDFVTYDDDDVYI